VIREQPQSIARPPVSQAPAFVRLVDPLVRRLLGMGLPMGPNTLLTIRGRKSGLPRSAGVALVDIGGRRWVISAYGETHWVRNLRAARRAVIQMRGRAEPVQAVELTPAAAVEFFREVLQPYLRGMPLPIRAVGWLFTRDIFRDPAAAAARRPVFELKAAEPEAKPA
jgi:deazaflavin-dependent oxidoreductase (nitroreductase family)